MYDDFLHFVAGCLILFIVCVVMDHAVDAFGFWRVAGAVVVGLWLLSRVAAWDERRRAQRDHWRAMV
ncbi:hypothetical protein ACQR10_04685 [Bradyrhizobium sp. HKCCYLRH2060]|uniref:hypothetical protein n=1 Tax=unclassified Bradyrhizobium TaxID=2631580 RepID=UPI003EC0E553